MNTAHAQRVVHFQEIRRIPLTAVLEYLGELKRLKRVGSSLVGICPICGGTNRRKFTVSFKTSPQLWRCFSPEHNAGGDALTFVSEYEKVDIAQAGQLIARWFAIGGREQSSQHFKQRRLRMSESSPNRPTHKVFSCTPREGQKDWLTEIGAAWPLVLKDGRTGLNINLTALPAGTRMVLFEADAGEPETEESPADKKTNGKRK